MDPTLDSAAELSRKESAEINFQDSHEDQNQATSSSDVNMPSSEHWVKDSESAKPEGSSGNTTFVGAGGQARSKEGRLNSQMLNDTVESLDKLLDEVNKGKGKLPADNKSQGKRLRSGGRRLPSKAVSRSTMVISVVRSSESTLSSDTSDSDADVSKSGEVEALTVMETEVDAKQLADARVQFMNVLSMTAKSENIDEENKKRSERILLTESNIVKLDKSGRTDDKWLAKPSANNKRQTARSAEHYECSNCKATFASRWDWLGHVSDAHKYPCRRCRTRYASRAELNEHLKTWHAPGRLATSSDLTKNVRVKLKILVSSVESGSSTTFRCACGEVVDNLDLWVQHLPLCSLHLVPIIGTKVELIHSDEETTTVQIVEVDSANEMPLDGSFDTDVRIKEEVENGIELDDPNTVPVSLTTEYADFDSKNILSEDSNRSIPITCDHCYTVFDSLRGLLQHKVCKPMRCRNCNCLLKNTEEKQMHLVVCDGLVRCIRCRQRLADDIGQSRAHIKAMTNDGVCPVCSEMPKLLAEHMDSVHGGIVGVYECDICSVQADRHALLNDHLMIHMKNRLHDYTCEICEPMYKTSSKYDFNKHLINRHLRPVKYSCNLCLEEPSVKLTTKEQWYHHFRVQHGRCPICRLDPTRCKENNGETCCLPLFSDERCVETLVFDKNMIFTYKAVEKAEEMERLFKNKSSIDEDGVSKKNAPGLFEIFEKKLGEDQSPSTEERRGKKGNETVGGLKEGVISVRQRNARTKVNEGIGICQPEFADMCVNKDDDIAVDSATKMKAKTMHATSTTIGGGKRLKLRKKTKSEVVPLKKTDDKKKNIEKKGILKMVSSKLKADDEKLSESALKPPPGLRMIAPKPVDEKSGSIFLLPLPPDVIKNPATTKSNKSNPNKNIPSGPKEEINKPSSETGVSCFTTVKLEAFGSLLLPGATEPGIELLGRQSLKIEQQFFKTFMRQICKEFPFLAWQIEKGLKCEDCRIDFESNVALAVHLLLEHTCFVQDSDLFKPFGKVAEPCLSSRGFVRGCYRCFLCNMVFEQTTVDYLLQHARECCQCYGCDRRFPCLELFRLHMTESSCGMSKRQHVLYPSLPCLICRDTYSLPELIEHLNEHMDRETFACHVCRLQFQSGQECLQHLSEHTDVQPYCFKCAKFCTSISDYLPHLTDIVQSHKEKSLKCRHCCHVADTELAFRNHLQSEHLCQICGSEMLSRESLAVHKRNGKCRPREPMRNESENEIMKAKKNLVVKNVDEVLWLNSVCVRKCEKTLCPVCGHAFLSENFMLGHLRRQHPSEAHCRVCASLSGDDHLLIPHRAAIHGTKAPEIRLQKGLVWHQCTRSCAFTCTSAYVVEAHEMVAHKHECPYCWSSFRQIGEFRSHCSKHKLEPRHKCLKCYGVFESKDQLEEHRAAHDSCHYVCSYCDHISTTQGAANEHAMCEHSLETPFEASTTECDAQNVENESATERDASVMCQHCGVLYDSTEIASHERGCLQSVQFEEIPCPKCESKFQTCDALFRHSKIHVTIHSQGTQTDLDISPRDFNELPLEEMSDVEVDETSIGELLENQITFGTSSSQQNGKRKGEKSGDACKKRAKFSDEFDLGEKLDSNSSEVILYGEEVETRMIESETVDQLGLDSTQNLVESQEEKLVGKTEVHGTQIEYSCAACEENPTVPSRFWTLEALNDHMDKVHNSVPEFDSDAVRFESSAKRKAKYECAECGKSYTQRTRLLHHNFDVHGIGKGGKSVYKEEKEVPFACSMCSNTYSSRALFISHMKTVHLTNSARASDEELHECELCHRRFKTLNALWKHVETHQ